MTKGFQIVVVQVGKQWYEIKTLGERAVTVRKPKTLLGSKTEGNGGFGVKGVVVITKSLTIVVV